MTQRVNTAGDRLPLLITIGIFVVLLACLPLAMMLDDAHDEDRPLFQDMLNMQVLQTAVVANKQRPVDVTVSDGESVEVGAGEFTASPGVTIVVRAVDHNSFCISGSNDLGVTSPERCSS